MKPSGIIPNPKFALKWDEPLWSDSSIHKFIFASDECAHASPIKTEEIEPLGWIRTA